MDCNLGDEPSTSKSFSLQQVGLICVKTRVLIYDFDFEELPNENGKQVRSLKADNLLLQKCIHILEEQLPLLDDQWQEKYHIKHAETQLENQKLKIDLANCRAENADLNENLDALCIEVAELTTAKERLRLEIDQMKTTLKHRDKLIEELSSQLQNGTRKYFCRTFYKSCLFRNIIVNFFSIGFNP